MFSAPKSVSAIKTRNLSESGSALIEFTLCCSFFLLPLLIGLLVVGQNMLRAMLVTQVCRDAAHMFSSGTDFSQSSYQSLVVNLSPSLGLTTTSGTSHGVVIFSEIALLDRTCLGTVSGSTPVCSNAGYYVVVKRLTIGTPAIQTSAFGTPTAALVDASGNVSQAGVLNDPSTRASAAGVSFAPPIVLPTSQYAYVVETFVTSPSGTGWSTTGPPNVSARFVF